MLHFTIYFKRLALACGLVLALLYGITLTLHPARAAQARSLNTIFTVTNTNNAGVGSLRRAILDANDNPGADAIVFDISGCSPAIPCVISPTNPLPLITDTLTISGTDAASLIIDANHTSRGLRIDSVPVRITDLTVQNGETPDEGGGIRSAGALALARVRLLNNHAGTYGGGVYAANGLLVDDGYFENNDSSLYGGGLYSGAGLGLSGTEFISNTAADGGGASAGVVWITGGRFERNSSSENGGGLNANSVLLTGTLFISNTADESGGGLATTGNAIINQGWFEDNGAANNGGGAFVDNDLFLANTTFISNTSDFGGGVYVLGEVRADQSWFENNHSDKDGGGLYALSPIQLADTTFIGNGCSAVGCVGGGVAATDPISVNRGWFENNHAGHGGGIMGFDSMTITHTTFISNTAGYGGGGVDISGPFTITAGIFIANQADWGGGMKHEDGSGLMINTLFARNIANVGTALDMQASSVVALAHSTIVGVEELSAQGIAVEGGTLFASDTILAHHAIGIQNLGGTIIQDYNLFFANDLDILGTFTGGVHSLIGDPRFLNPDANDYHLGIGSAAMDTGTNAGVAVDFENDARPQGPGFDIGYDEASAVNRLYLPLVLR